MGRTIITQVSFDVERVLKGRIGARTQLTFLGGTIGDETLHVADMPQFRVGDRDLLFLSGDQRSISPLVAFAYGRFRIVRDVASGAEMIRTHDGRPLVSTADLGRPLTPLLRLPRTLTLSDFESAVRQRVDARQR
jgi:hypothetical protein